MSTDEKKDPTIKKIEDALKEPDVSLHLVKPLAISVGGKSLGVGVQVKVKNRKVGPVIFPNEGQSIVDVLAWLGSMTA